MSKNKAIITTNNKPIEQQRLDKFRTKKAQTKSPISYHIKSTEGNKVSIETKVNNTVISSNTQHLEVVQADLYAATGTVSQEYGRLILSQAISTFSNSTNGAISNAKVVHEALLAMNPADEYEGMLCSRLLVLHDQYMNFMFRATSSDHEATIDLNINRSTKLMRLYNETLDALNKYRRKGEQKITIQHVNVNNGGQAIVTSEMALGGDTMQKDRE